MADDPMIMGVKNSESIKALEARMALELKHVNNKLDTIDKKVDKISSSVESLIANIPNQVKAEVEQYMKSGVYNFIKWMLITFCGATIVLAAGYVFKNFAGG